MAKKIIEMDLKVTFTQSVEVEVDEEMLTEIILDLKASKYMDTSEAGKAAYQREIDWLESLRPQSHWKPSEQQLKTLQVAIDIIGEVTLTGTDLKELLEQLKKLRG